MKIKSISRTIQNISDMKTNNQASFKTADPKKNKKDASLRDVSFLTAMLCIATLPAGLFAQAPSISYGGPQSYSENLVGVMLNVKL